MRYTLLTLSFTLTALAQQSVVPAFEVASLKISHAETTSTVSSASGAIQSTTSGHSCRRPNPGSLSCMGVTLKHLLTQAYGVKSYQIEGPAWLDTDIYDLIAKVPEGVPAEKVPAMLQALLAERFQVVLHTETRQYPGYEITVAKGGPKLKDVDPSEVAAYRSAQEAAKASGNPAPGPSMPPPGQRRGSPPMGLISASVSPNGITRRGKMTMDELAVLLSSELWRPVLDETELKGVYDIELTYEANLSVPGPDDPTSTLIPVVQQTLGLKIDSKKVPLEFLTIRSANRLPAEN